MALPYEKEYEALIKEREPGAEVDFDPETISRIVADAVNVFKSQPNVLALHGDMFLVGDVHGQLHDILNYFRTLGSPMEYNYLFLGDIVDRGVQSVESLLLVLICKIRRPNNFFIIRGNHETFSQQESTYTYTLKQECRDRYKADGALIYEILSSCFPYLPLLATIENRILCLHGCIASDFDLDAIKGMELPFVPEDIPDPVLRNVVNNILWSDPLKYNDAPENYSKHECELLGQNFFILDNYARGTGEVVDDDLMCAQLDRYSFDILVRGHECIEDGMSVSKSGRVFTIFGATNYYKTHKTASCVMHVDSDLSVRFIQFASE